MHPTEKEIESIIKNNFDKPFLYLYRDLGIIDIMSLDLKELFQKNKHFSEDTYGLIFK